MLHPNCAKQKSTIYDVASWTRKIGVVIRKWVFASRIDSRKTSRCWSTNSVVRVSFLWSWGYSKGRRHQSFAEQNLVSSRDRGKILWNNTIRKVNRSGLAVVAGGIGRIVFGLPEEKCSEILKYAPYSTAKREYNHKTCIQQ